MLKGGQTDPDGVPIADAPMAALGLAEAPRIAGAGVDLLREKAGGA